MFQRALATWLLIGIFALCAVIASAAVITLNLSRADRLKATKQEQLTRDLQSTVDAWKNEQAIWKQRYDEDHARLTKKMAAMDLFVKRVLEFEKVK